MSATKNRFDPLLPVDVPPLATAVVFGGVGGAKLMAPVKDDEAPVEVTEGPKPAAPDGWA